MSRFWILLALWSLIAGCSSPASKTNAKSTQFPYRIYAVYEGWHTSLILSASDLSPYLPALQTELQGQAFVRFGWGDGDYFTGKSKSTGAAAKALFFSGYSALQVLNYQQSPLPNIARETWVPLAISKRGLRKLAQYLDASLARDAQGALIPLPAYEQNTGQFYRARVSYGLFSNCNTWSGRALQAAGLPVKSSFHLTAQSVFKQLKHISASQYKWGLLQPADFQP